MYDLHARTDAYIQTRMHTTTTTCHHQDEYSCTHPVSWQPGNFAGLSVHHCTSQWYANTSGFSIVPAIEGGTTITPRQPHTPTNCRIVLTSRVFAAGSLFPPASLPSAIVNLSSSLIPLEAKIKYTTK